MLRLKKFFKGLFMSVIGLTIIALYVYLIGICAGLFTVYLGIPKDLAIPASGFVWLAIAIGLMYAYEDRF